MMMPVVTRVTPVGTAALATRPWPKKYQPADPAQCFRRLADRAEIDLGRGGLPDRQEAIGLRVAVGAKLVGAWRVPDRAVGHPGTRKRIVIHKQGAGHSMPPMPPAG